MDSLLWKRLEDFTKDVDPAFEKVTKKTFGVHWFLTMAYKHNWKISEFYVESGDLLKALKSSTAALSSATLATIWRALAFLASVMSCWGSGIRCFQSQ